MKLKSVCFTGHRNFSNTEKTAGILANELERLIKNGAEDFYAGGAVGWDNFCADIVLGLKAKYPRIKLHIIMPCPVDEQTLKWSESEKKHYRNILSLADSTEICSPHYSSGCMKKRNARLAELADCCVCYLDPCRKRSGTFQTVQMAIDKGIEVNNMYWLIKCILTERECK